MKITFLGGGNMATALIGGLCRQGFDAARILVIEPVAAQRDKLVRDYGVRCAASVDAAAIACDALVLAVKPQQMKEAVAPLAGRLDRQLLISIAAGLRLPDLARWLGGHTRLVRAMPNTPALIGAGITGLFADPSVDTDGRAAAEKILSAVGTTVWVDAESSMDAVTAISGSGPAYVFYLIEALEAAARDLGLDEATAHRLAAETFLGAARLVEQSPEPVAILRERVTSKGGTTAAALKSFDDAGLRGIIQRGTKAAQQRGRELGAELGKD